MTRSTRCSLDGWLFEPKKTKKPLHFEFSTETPLDSGAKARATNCCSCAIFALCSLSAMALGVVDFQDTKNFLIFSGNKGVMGGANDYASHHRCFSGSL